MSPWDMAGPAGLERCSISSQKNNYPKSILF